MKIKSTFTTLLVLAVLLFLLVSCTTPSEKGSTTSGEPKAVKPAPEKSGSPTFATVVDVKPAVEPQLSPEIAEMIEKGKQVSSYKYLFDAEKAHPPEISIRSGKVKKVYKDTFKLKEDVYYNEVYLDLNMRTAIGVCTKLGSVCSPIWNKAYKVSYEKESVFITPQELLDLIGLDAQRMGEELIDNQKTVIIKFTDNQGRKEKLWIDWYSNLPLKQVIYTMDGEDEKILETHTFSRLIMGVKNSEVTLPENFELQ